MEFNKKISLGITPNASFQMFTADAFSYEKHAQLAWSQVTEGTKQNYCVTVQILVDLFDSVCL